MTASVTEDGEVLELPEDAAPKIAEFLSKFMKDIEIEEGIYILLFHEKGGNESELESFALGFDEKVEDVVDQILEEASDHHGSKLGRTKYVLRIKGRKAKMCFALKLQGEFSVNRNFEDDPPEGPTVRGHMQASLRHTEVAYNQLSTGFQLTQQAMAEMMNLLRDENDKLRKDNTALRKDYEEVKSMNIAREIEYKKYLADEERKKKMMEFITGFVPVIFEGMMRGRGEKEALTEIQNVFNGMSQQDKDFLFQALQNQPAARDKIMSIYELAMRPQPPGMLQGIMGAMAAGASSPEPPGPPGPPGPPAGP